jgi:hypothetical protein
MNNSEFGPWAEINGPVDGWTFQRRVSLDRESADPVLVDFEILGRCEHAKGILFHDLRVADCDRGCQPTEPVRENMRRLAAQYEAMRHQRFDEESA